jgi:hypothetical protein
MTALLKRLGWLGLDVVVSTIFIGCDILERLGWFEVLDELDDLRTNEKLGDWLFGKDQLT